MGKTLVALLMQANILHCLLLLATTSSGMCIYIGTVILNTRVHFPLLSFRECEDGTIRRMNGTNGLGVDVCVKINLRSAFLPVCADGLEEEGVRVVCNSSYSGKQASLQETA